MLVSAELHDGRLDLIFRGRLDAHGCLEAQPALDRALTPEVTGAVADLTGVDYLSSAGLRLLLALSRRLQAAGGVLALAGPRDYCRRVIDLAGFAGAFPVFDTAAAAREYCGRCRRAAANLAAWDRLETLELDSGVARVLPGGPAPGAARILGDVKDVLYARVTPEKISSKRFSQTEYSIGLGALGDRPEDYLPLLGEMITIGGTMVWLPTDGHDTPDFLIPRSDRGQVTLHTGFNVALDGGFNECLMFASRDPAGVAIGRLYRELFDSARRRRPDFKGALALVLRAQLGAVFGSGIRQAPLPANAPANGEMITHPAQIKDWFEFDAAPRHTGVTGLICGLGADLTGDLSAYDQTQFNRVFYLNPANTGGRDSMLHNHAVIFREQPLADRAADLQREIDAVVENGEFLDMRHLLDNSTITRAFLGVSYLQEFRPDQS